MAVLQRPLTLHLFSPQATSCRLVLRPEATHKNARCQWPVLQVLGIVTSDHGKPLLLGTNPSTIGSY